MKLNRTQKNIIINAYHEFGLEFCEDNAMLISCVESATSKNNALNDEVNQYLKDYDQFNNLYEQGRIDLADSYAKLYL